MKLFNLEEYLANPSRKVVTREGRQVRIICTDAKREAPVVALIEDNGEEYPFSYPPDGMWCKKNKSDMDLFFVSEKKVIFGNLYSTQHGTTFSGDFYKTEEEALKGKCKDFSKYITTFKVEWEE